MSETVRLSNFASIANAVFNSVSANSTAVTAMTVGGHTINATGFPGTANNASNLGGVAAASYALLAGPTFTGNTTVANLAFTGLRITGDFSNATPANRLAFQSSTTNGATGLYVLPNGSATVTAVQLLANSNPSNTSMGAFITNSTEVQVSSTRTGTGDLLPLTFSVGGSERVRITTNGDVGIGTTNPVLGLGVFRDNGNGWAAWIGASAAGSRVGLGTRSSTASVQGFNSSGNGADLALNPDGGNVGVGTTAPVTKLHVTSTAQTDTIGLVQIESTLAANAVNASYTAKNFSGTSQFMQWENFGVRIGSRIMTNSGQGAIIFTAGNDVERMRIDASGRVTRPAQPAFNSYGGSTITTTGSYQTGVFTSVNVNTGSCYNSSNGRFTAPVAGNYFFSWSFVQMGSATGPAAYLLVNGSAVVSQGAISYWDSYTSASASTVVSLAANDFVTIGFIGFNSSFSNIDMGWSGMSGFLI